MKYRCLSYSILYALLYIQISCKFCFGSGESFHRTSDCVCSGDSVTYECTVCGGLATVWEGTAFDCDSNGDQIILTHRNFGTSASLRECNNGRIVGQGLSVDNGCYTSQLNVTFEPDLQNRTIECSVDTGAESNKIDQDILRMSTEPFPSPIVSVQEVTSTEILFSWNQTHSCPSLYNDIFSNNCGTCPNDTTGTQSALCVNFTTSGDITVCNFTLQVVICGNSGTPIRGNMTSLAVANLTVPYIKEVSTTPHYLDDGELSSLSIRFMEVGPFIIADGINGSIDSYTIILFSHVNSTEPCDTRSILPSNCSDEICSEEYNVTSSNCDREESNRIHVAVYVITNLGDGPMSDLITEEYQNSYVTVEVVAQTTSIHCTFPEMITAVDYSCNATIIYGPNCQNRTNLTGEMKNSSLISIGLNDFIKKVGTSNYCRFIANVSANKTELTVRGSLIGAFVTVVRDNSAIIAAAVLLTPFTLVIVGMSILVCVMQSRRGGYTPDHEVLNLEMKTTKIPKMYLVKDTCNMIEFARKLHHSYNPDSGIGYYQLQPGSTEYISSTTDVVLINEDQRKVCTGFEARQLVGFCDSNTGRRQPIGMPGTPWSYAFIQCTSRIRELPAGTHFIFYPEVDDTVTQSLSSVGKPMGTDNVDGLKVVDAKYFTLHDVEEKCLLREFIVKKNVTSRGNLDLGYCFYEFTKSEFIQYSKQVILMDKDGQLHYGPSARRQIGLDPEDYDQVKEKGPPSFGEEYPRWKKAFIQTTSNCRELQPGTQVLYCTVASDKVVEVIEPFKTYKVDQLDEDSRKMINFAKMKILDYNPNANYVYYEFTKREFVLPDRNVMALKKSENEGEPKAKLYTGPGVRKLIGAPDDYDGTTELDPPKFAESDEWDCIFIQSKSYRRELLSNTRFLYCEYDHVST